jgi:hypothetical protein
MSIKLKNLDFGLGVVFIGEGVVTGQEIIQANKKILSFEEKIKISKYCIIDYYEASTYDVSTPEIRIIADQDKEISKYLPDYIVAIVAKRNLEFGVSRMWQTIIELNDLKWDTEIFKDRNDAEKWIKNKVKEKYDIDLTCRL